MRSFGDWGSGDHCVSVEKEVYRNSMSAIIRLFTPDGFVVATDGRMLASATDEIGSDEVQKVFLLKHHSSSIIGSIGGIGQIIKEDGTSLDFRAVLVKAAKSTERRQANDLHSYAGLIVSEIEPLIKDFRSTSIPGSKDAAGTSIFLDGLFPMPAQETISITYGPSGTQITYEFVPLQVKRAYCSAKVWELLFNDIPTIPSGFPNTEGHVMGNKCGH